MMTWMVDYFYNRVQNVIAKYTVERHYLSLNEETGGMNDVLYKLFRVSVGCSYDSIGYGSFEMYLYCCELFHFTYMFLVDVIRQIQSIYCWLICLTNHAF